MAILKANDAQLHYELQGPQAAPVLVFSHSLGASFSMWDPQAAEFRNRFQVLAYDTRGHGLSFATPGPYSIEQLGHDVLSLLDALKIDRVHFCGLSMGGMIGMWLGANAPERLHRLILCNTGARIGTVESWNTRILAVQKGGMSSVAAAIIERWFTSGYRGKAPDTVAKTKKMIEDTNVAGYVACCAAVRDFDGHPFLETIRTPTLVIAGAQDPATPPADGRFLAEHIPGARYAELNAAHLSNLEDRQTFNREIAAFLQA